MNYENAEKEIKKLLLETENAKICEKIVDFIFEKFEKYNWIGIYIVKRLYLNLIYWRGEKATEHTTIPLGMGICGSAAKKGITEIIPDVNKDNRYLSCFVNTKSEIVVPIKKNGTVIGEIDIDSDIPNAFNDKDSQFLEKIVTNKTFIESVLNY